MREATQVVGHAEHWVLLPLPLISTAVHLQVHLIDHAQARGPDGMAKALQATIDLAGHLAIGVIEAVHDVLDRAAFR